MIDAIVAGLFGLLIGSFLNVCIHRLPRDLSVVKPRSRCPSCEKTIAWYDNIPVVSWVLLRGRCRYCRTGIAFRYPAVEILTGVLFFLAVLGMGPVLAAGKHCLFAAIMVGLIFTDLDERILPDEFTVGGTVLGLAFAALVFLPPELVGFWLPDASERLVSLAESASGALIPATALWLVGEVYAKIRGREGLGLGDVKMVACIGAFLGLGGALLTIMAGSILGSIAGILYIRLARRDAATYELPFGTFLGIAAIGVAFGTGPLAAWIHST